MVDVSARVMFSQVFENKSESPTSRAKYVFPLPTSATSCAFELEHADGRVITGVVKESSEAAEAFHGVADAERSAGLVEFFTISVGSIPAQQKVTVRLTFVMDLLDEERQDHVYLQLPMAIAKRYGETSAALFDANERTRAQITVDVQTSGVIQDIRSPSHRISLLRYRTRAGTQSERRMTAKWSSTTFLDQDFVLTVHALGLNEPRCFAEVHPQHANTIAMQLSFIPKFKMPRVASQEYIFIVDRSSCMSGASMEITKRTLEILLHLLPDSDTTFNIFNFASDVDGIWKTSVSFNNRNMQYAISDIQAIQASNSGTAFAHALQLAVASRNHNRPTVIFVLTGGGECIGVSPLQGEGMFARCRRVVTQVLSRVKRLRSSSYSNTYTNLDPFEVVSAAVNNCRPNAPLRVFTIGIGEHVASAVCERLARAGRGECLFAIQAEDIIEKFARLLNAGRTGVIESVVVDWHGLGHPPVANFLPSNYDHPLPPSVVQLEPSPPIQQVPHKITKIFPDMCFNVFAITTFRSIPPEIRLRVKVEGLAEVLELVVPVTEVKPPLKDELPLLHTLAARELIQHLAEGRAPLPKPTIPTTSEEVQKAAIVRLGLEYQLVSQHTSFIAIKSRREAAGSGLRVAIPRERFRRQYYYPSPPRVTSDAAEDYALGIDVSVVQMVLDSLSQVVDTVFSFFTSDQAALIHLRPQRLLPGTYNSTAQSRSSSPLSQSARPFYHDTSSTDTFSTLSSLEGSSINSQWTHPSEDSIQRIPSPVFSPTRDARLKARLLGRVVVSGSRPPPVPEEVYTLILLQGYDGSFARSPQLEVLVGVEVLERAANLQVDDNIWATAVVVAYLEVSPWCTTGFVACFAEQASGVC
ncbi:hypothetical protein BD769DRAFT_1443119 [Suillus cothurnatus]|nr:hypothetical protein BD769DRAFT_1443119 [Suillus cothurnatus]